ncbi:MULTISPECIES: hypothetical protein [unclassified Bradyrhizobium]|uniref:hypothetical protein n=1 Tax=unclassified Bradyrhizobium TaxID=2631580 RepID=UPI0029162A71|nr:MULTISPECIES: hypothetical protein [unclassified Bradyrhizobium]
MIPLELKLYQFIGQIRLPILIKGLISAGMIYFAINVLTGSQDKALGIGLSGLLLALFSTWRRFVESLSFLIFIISLIAFCGGPELAERLSRLPPNTRVAGSSPDPHASMLVVGGKVGGKSPTTGE